MRPSQLSNHPVLRRRISPLLWVLCLTAPAGGETEGLVIHRVAEAVVIDGLSHEVAWHSVQPLPVITQVPNYGDTPSEHTEILLAHDDTYLYVAGRFYDRQPEAIHATAVKRDDDDDSSDSFTLVLDTFDDNENALVFTTTPTGSRRDLAISGDLQLSDDLDPNWNTFWDVATVRTDSGWFAEMRIPFSSLRFQTVGGRVHMGVIAFRWIARREERVIFPAIPMDWGSLSYMKPSQAVLIVLSDIPGSRPLYITPYLLGGGDQNWRLDTDRYRRRDDAVFDVGLDAKYGLSSNLTVDLTVNTDFAQVEADDQQVNLTRYPLFFPEKRLFFLERTSNFDFGFYRDNTLFHSRRIGIHQGRPVPIYGGARLVGRIGAWDVGLLTMQSQAASELPSETFGVLRLRRQVLNPFSYAGAIATTRIGTDGGYNTAYGIDSSLRMFGDDYLKLNFAQVYDDSTGENPLSLRRSKVRAHWERYRYDGWAYGLNYSRSGADYDPGLGFEKWPDNSSFVHFTRYGWDADPGSRLYQLRLYEDVWLHLRNSDNSLESRLSRVGFVFDTRSGWSSHIALAQHRESLLEDLPFAENTIAPAGEYTYYDASAQVSMPAGGLLNADLSVAVGQFYDGRRLSFEVETTRSLSRRWELAASYGIDDVNFDERDDGFRAHVGGLKVLATFSASSSLSSFVQYNSAVDQIITNVRLRYNPHEGTDLFLVYDEGLHTDRHAQEPILPRRSGRALMLKVYTTLVR